MNALGPAEKALLLASLLFYFSGAVQGIGFLFAARRERGFPGVAAAVVLLGFLLHSAFIGWRWRQLGSFPPGHGRFEGLVFLVWTVILLHLLLQLYTRAPALSAFVMPVVVVLFAGVFLSIDHSAGDRPVFRDYWIYSHMVSAFLAYATFVVAFVLGLMYLVQERELRAKRMSRLLRRLPPIETLAELAGKAVLVGFPLLSYSLVLGGVRAAQQGTERWLADPKVLSALATWLFYAAFLAGRLGHWLSGRKVAYFSIVGFGAVLFTYLVTGLLFGAAHPFR